MSLEALTFDGPNDPQNPWNWSLAKRIYHFGLLGVTTMIVAITSSIFASAIPNIMAIYRVDRTVGMLGVSLYVLGFASGPVCWAPLSEWKGRYTPMVASMMGFTVFSFAAGASNHISALMVFRYLTGFCGAGPLTLSGAASADLFPADQRGPAVVIFCLTVFVGALTAPFIGGFIIINRALTWRWIAFIPGIMGGAVLILLITTLQETYAPAILARKADQLRCAGSNYAKPKPPAKHAVSISHLWTVYFCLPFRMLFCDPLVLAMCVFGSFVYGLLYLFLTAYHIIFQQIHGMNPGVGGLPYLGIVVGQVLGVVGVLAFRPWVVRQMKRNAGVMVPEWHLPITIPGVFAFAVGLVWLGWSGYRSTTSWMVPTASGLLTGFGLFTMFLPSLAYLVDAYPTRAASAIAAHTTMRSAAGAAFPLFSTYMFDRLGVEWACTLLGCVAVLLVAIPLLCYIYGERIRNRSRVFEQECRPSP